MTKQTKKLIAIFVVMAITMFTIIKAFGEVTKVQDSNGLSTYYSTELKDYNIMVVDNVEDVYLMNNAWDKTWENYKYPHKSTKAEIVLPVTEASEDIFKLLDITGAVYMVKEDQDGKICMRFWKNKKGEIYVRMVVWNIINQKE